QFRRRLQWRRTPEQKNRNNNLDATLPPASGDDIQREAARLADATQFIKMPDLAAPLRATHRAINGHPATQQCPDLAELQPIRPSFVESAPLFYYILKEAQLREDGLRLGPIGARIVAEVFIGLLQLDPDSYLSVQTSW